MQSIVNINAFEGGRGRGLLRPVGGVNMTAPQSLGAPRSMLAAVMRRMPVHVRKVNWWWMRLYDRLGGGGFSEDPAADKRWPAGLQAPVRGHYHPYRLRLNLQDWMERRAYFSGALYQREIELVLKRLVRRGDQVIDIGANIGLVTMLCAHRAGPNGRVIACEANPAICRRLQDHITLNRLDGRVRAVQGAVGAAPSTATLFIEGEHAGKGTLAASKGRAIEVDVLRGDDVFADIDPARPLIVKIDVEGYEAQVLAGMGKTLTHPDCAILIEVTEDMLAAIGDSARKLYDILHANGYSGYAISPRAGRFTRSFRLTRSRGPAPEAQYDALFIKAGSSVAGRLKGSGVID